MTIITAALLVSPIFRELKSYRYIRKKDFNTYTGICTKKDFDILPKGRGYEFSYYIDFQDHIGAIHFKRIKVPRYIYKKTLTGEVCELIIVNPTNKKLLYVYPGSTSYK